MHIDSIQLYRVPLGDSTLAAGGAAIESLLVRMAGGGREGWGEVSLAAGPVEGPEWSAGAFACLRDWLAPATIGRTIRSGEDLQAGLAMFLGNAHAKAALDMAWWNLAAVEQDKPLYQLLGGRNVGVRLSTTVGVMDATEPLFAAIRAAFEAGYESVVLKFRPGWDLNMVRAVRQEFPSQQIAIDCDGLCTLGQQETFYRLEDFYLNAIEQPLAADDLVGNAMLQQSLRTPITLDQSITSLARVEQAIDLGSCRQIKIEPGRVGGLTPALAIRAACEAAQIPCAVGGVPQGALATAAAMALATLPNFSAPADLFSFDKQSWITTGDLPTVEKSAAGKLEFLFARTSGPGVSVDEPRLARAAIEHATIG